MGLYRAVGKPLFFALPPETAHHLALALLGLPVPWSLVAGAVGLPTVPTRLAGIDLPNPVGLAAGFDKGCERLGPLGRLGFGYVVGGTVTRHPRAGNERPRIRRVRGGSMVNAMGLPNPGADAVAARLAASPRGGPRLASIADEAREDVVATHALLEPHVDAIELNASCPNVAWGRDRDNEAHLGDLLVALAGRTKPLFVKLPPFRTDTERDVVLALARIARDGGVDGLTCSNTAPVDDAHLSTGRGGLSGRALAAGTPRIVEAVGASVGGSLPINACGGIDSPATARAALEAGATTVQLYTGLLHGGPGLPARIVRGLAS